MRDDREWLLDILEAIERIEKYSSRGKRAFEEDELIQSWIVHHQQIIGEALRSISEDFRGKHNDMRTRTCLNSALPLIIGIFMCGQIRENRRGKWFPELQTSLRFYHRYRRL